MFEPVGPGHVRLTSRPALDDSDGPQPGLAPADAALRRRAAVAPAVADGRLVETCYGLRFAPAGCRPIYAPPRPPGFLLPGHHADAVAADPVLAAIARPGHLSRSALAALPGEHAAAPAALLLAGIWQGRGGVLVAGSLLLSAAAADGRTVTGRFDGAAGPRRIPVRWLLRQALGVLRPGAPDPLSDPLLPHEQGMLPLDFGPAGRDPAAPQEDPHPPGQCASKTASVLAPWHFR